MFSLNNCRIQNRLCLLRWTILLVMLPSILWLRASPSYYAFEAIILLFHRSWSEVNRLNLSLPRNTLVALIHKSWMQISWNNDRLRNFRWSLLLFYWFLYVSSNFSKMNRDFIFFLQLILIWFSILLSAWWSCCHLGVISNDLLNRLSCTYILIDIFAIYKRWSWSIFQSITL